MLHIAPYPMLRIAAALVAGILFGHAFPQWELYGGYSALICLLLSIGLIFVPFSLKQMTLGILGHLIAFSIGCFVISSAQEIDDSSHFANKGEYTAYIGVVDDEVLPKPNSVATQLKVQYVQVNGQWQKASGSILAYFPKQTKGLQYGDWVLSAELPQKVEPSKNPGEFDYGAYLSNLQVYHRQYVRSGTWHFLKHEPESKLWEWAFATRARLSGILEEAMGKGAEGAVASMLILGIRQTIPEELNDAYAGAGAMHILAVSGMHVGLIFALIEMIFGRFANHFSLRPVFYILAILCIWVFGFLTAFSPSVLRAVVMFSFLLLGKWYTRKTSLYNALGFTAFFILILNPSMVFNVGFQLSFLAVFGIAYLHPRLNTLYTPSNKWLKLGYEMTSISISAQVATLPLCFFYFNQYPVYSLISNLWVVPLGTLILYVGIFFFLGAGIAWWKVLWGWVLKVLVGGLNISMFKVTELPFALLQVPAFQVWEAFFLAFFLVCLLLLFQLKQKKYLSYAVLWALLYSGSRLYNSYERHVEQKLVFYSLKGKTCFALLTGETVSVWMDSKLLEERSAVKRAVLDPLRKRGCSTIVQRKLPDGNFLININGRTVLFVNDGTTIIQKLELQPIDFLYVTNRCVKMTNFVAFSTAKEIILPKQFSFIPSDWANRIWNLQEKGALEVKL